jgi:uroporphyrinogen-III synthase
VLVLESRRARELGSIVTSYGGTPVLAPSMREVPLESNAEALTFADGLMLGEFDLVIFLTGVGARALVEIVERVRGDREPFLRALRETAVVVRGPKPLAVMREMNVPVWLAAREPNTWRELLAALDGKAAERPLAGLRLAVQEYGASNEELLAALRQRGAAVTPVPVYKWAMPEDLGPLREAVASLVDGRIDVAMFTTSTQLVHLLRLADEMGHGAAVRDRLRRIMIASIGPTTSDELRQHGIAPDMEPSHPKMGFLVREAAEQASELLRRKGA